MTHCCLRALQEGVVMAGLSEALNGSRISSVDQFNTWSSVRESK